MRLLVQIALIPVALADPRVFAPRGSKDCQACLSEVEASCRGPTSSDQFNDCFCSIGDEGLAWPELEKCVSGQDARCPEDIQYDILGDWGAHCFAYKKDEEEEVCVDSTQDKKLLMSVADMFCTEFLTLTSSSTPSTPTSTTTSTEVPTTDADDDAETTAVVTSTETETSLSLTTPLPTNTAADSNSGADAGSSGDDSDSEDEEDGVSGLSPAGFGTAAVLALCISSFVLQVL